MLHVENRALRQQIAMVASRDVTRQYRMVCIMSTGEHLNRLKRQLVLELYGSNREFLDGEELVGIPADPVVAKPNRGLSGQRGLHYPEPPADDPAVVVGAP